MKPTPRANFTFLINEKAKKPSIHGESMRDNDLAGLSSIKFTFFARCSSERDEWLKIKLAWSGDGINAETSVCGLKKAYTLMQLEPIKITWNFGKGILWQN